VTTVKGSANISAPQTAVTGAMRNIRLFTGVTPIRSTRTQ
jgi:hypothetical protein